MVVYANDQRSRFGGSQQPQVEEGASVRERQTILRLPDLSQMQVRVNVHESKIDMLGQAMKRAEADGEQLPARVRILDRTLIGSLTSIANQPEPSSWWSGNVKEYATIISIEGTPQGLRPGMTAECEILVKDLDNVLKIPVAAVVEMNGGYFCWVRQDRRVQRRPLLLGSTNDRFVEVKDGVREGELVVLNPRAMIAEARDVQDQPAEQTDADAFSKTPRRGASDGSAGPAGPGPGKGGKTGRPASGGAGPDAPSGRSQGPGSQAAEDPASAGGRPGGRGGSGRRGSFDLMQLDKDNDGKISKEEAPSQMQTFFDRLDGNGDGYIDRAEISAMRKRRAGGGGPGGKPAGQ
jgi:hypothetical protein